MLSLRTPNSASMSSSHSQSTRSHSKKRLNLDLTVEAYTLLQKIADESGKNMADILRTGLALYGIAQQEGKQGRSLAIVEGDEVKKEIVLT